MKNIWEWIDYLTRGLEKATNDSSLKYQQVHAYIDGHDKEVLKEAVKKSKEALNKAKESQNYVVSDNGTTYEICVDDDGNLSTKKVGDS